MLFLADSDAIPHEIMREHGFWDFIIYALVLVGILDKLRGWFFPSERKISGMVQTEPAVQHAEKSELLALARSIDDMREENAALHRNAQVEGQSRVRAIAEDVNTEMSTLANRIGELSKLITTALVNNAKQGAEISGIQSSIYRHDAEVREIQNRIAELMRHPTKRAA